MTWRTLIARLVVMLVATQIACAPPTRPNGQLRSGALARSNVLLVTIDTLRADRVGAYGGGSLTPALDALAARGVRFTRAHSHAPLTLPAHTSILTGLQPAAHGVHNNGVAGVAAGVPTLATRLHDAGYRTGAFVGAFVLDARFGLSRGFDTYDDRVGSDTGPITFSFAERRGDEVVALAGDWIVDASSKRGRAAAPPSPWFCWIHLFDPHAPYRAPEHRAADPYDNEVAYADAQLGQLIDRLRSARLLDSTLVVALADHGESLGDHGELTHGLFAYESTLHIPLIVAGPSIHAAVSDVPTAQADVMPTVLDLLGLAPPSDIDGRSALPAIRGDAVGARTLYFEALDAYLTRGWAPLTGVLVDGWKYIDLPDPELYDLVHDPGELHNRVADDRPRVDVMRRRLAERRPPSAALARTPPPLDPDAAARLRSLGYAAGQPAVPVRPFTSADDPKRLLDLDRQYQRALALTGDRQYTNAASLLQAIVEARPDFIVAYLNLASVYMASGDPGRAIATVERARTRGVTSLELQARLGAAYLAAGDLTRAAITLEPVARPDTTSGLDALNTLAIVLTEQRRFDRARRMFADVLAQSPRSATTWSNVGLLELADNKPGEAARAFEHAVDADARLAQAWEGLGAARIRSDPDGAADAWRRAIDLEPRNYDLLFNLAATLHDRGRDEAARPYIERFIREAPRERYARDIATVRTWLKRR
jgi:arylsulfatase A-like enzyme/Tfp pilus assembly protein PilF